MRVQGSAAASRRAGETREGTEGRSHRYLLSFIVEPAGKEEKVVEVWSVDSGV